MGQTAIAAGGVNKSAGLVPSSRPRRDPAHHSSFREE